MTDCKWQNKDGKEVTFNKETFEEAKNVFKQMIQAVQKMGDTIGETQLGQIVMVSTALKLRTEGVLLLAIDSTYKSLIKVVSQIPPEELKEWLDSSKTSDEPPSGHHLN